MCDHSLEYKPKVPIEYHILVGMIFRRLLKKDIDEQNWTYKMWVSAWAFKLSITIDFVFANIVNNGFFFFSVRLL